MSHILQISSGQGPAECRLFVPLLADIICNDAAQTGVSCRNLSEYSAKDEQLASLRLVVDGAGLEAFRKSWEGTIQWIWKSTIRPHWPRKNWFVQVSFFDFNAVDAKAFKLSELKFDTFHASGAGGQRYRKFSFRVNGLADSSILQAKQH